MRRQTEQHSNKIIDISSNPDETIDKWNIADQGLLAHWTRQMNNYLQIKQHTNSQDDSKSEDSRYRRIGDSENGKNF